MDAFEMLLTRRSVRKFLNKPIEDEKIHQLLGAGMSAPSARNTQPWHFVVIKDKKQLETISTASPYAPFCKDSAVTIVPCVDLSLVNEDFWVQDLSAATQNILLAARALDLGGVWIGIYPNKERVENVKKILNLSDNIMAFSLIPLGYTEIEQKKQQRFKSERVHYDQW